MTVNKNITNTIRQPFLFVHLTVITQPNKT